MNATKMMECILDLQMTYGAPGLENFLTEIDLLDKICGKDNENIHYIEETVGAGITVDPKWSGIQDGVTFNIKHKTVPGIRDAEYLVSQVLETVKEDISTFLGAMNKAPNAVTMKHEVSSVTCGICGKSARSSLADFEKHVQSHPKEKPPTDVKLDEKQELEKRLAETLGKEMTMEAFAQSLHATYSIPAKNEAPATATQESLHDNSLRGEDYYRYPAHTDQSRTGDSYQDQHYEARSEEKGHSGPSADTGSDARQLQPAQGPSQVDDREATAEYYRQLREFLLPKEGQEGQTSTENRENEGTRRSSSPAPVGTLKNALSTLAGYRSVSRSPETNRTVEITKRRKSRSRSRSRKGRRRKIKTKRHKLSDSSSSSSSRSRSKSRDRYGKWTASHNRKRSSSESSTCTSSSSSTSSSSVSRERRRKRSHSGSSSTDSTERRGKRTKQSSSPAKGSNSG